MNNRVQVGQLIALCVIALLLGVITLAVISAPRAPTAPSGGISARGTTNYDDLSISTLTTSGATTVGGALAVTGASTFTGAATYSANPILPSQSITPTDGGTFTPTLRLVTLTPAGALGTALGVCTTGQATILYNSVNANVVITDTGNFIGAGNQTLGQYDTLPLVCIDSKWVQIGPVSAN